MRDLRIPVTLAATAGLIVTMGIGSTASGRPQSIGKGAEVVDPGVTSKRDADFRPGAKAPTAAQRDRAAKTASGVRWNRFGTPSSLRASTATQTATAADPAGIARAYLAANSALYKLSAATIADMEVLVSRPMGKGSVVVLRQRFGGIPAGSDGLATLGIGGGKVVYVSSSLVPDAPGAAPPAPATIDEVRAFEIARGDAGLAVDQVATSRVKPTVVPMPAGGARTAYQVVLLAKTDTAFTTYVDARSGAVLLRDDLVDHDSDNPEWAAFPANPPGDYSSTDTRVKWCLVQAPGCERSVSVAGTGQAWDTDATGTPTLTTSGISARSTEKWDSLSDGTVGTRTATPSPTREYLYPWTNQWHEARCNPAVFDTPQQNDIDAAMANLFATHNRMHDWSYHLGFTPATWNLEGDDPELGNAQAGGRAGGAPPAYPSRDNANQFSPPDGVAPVTNMFLWQALPGIFYAPCVDGDFDTSVIGHEYSHAISGRLIAGPDRGWQGAQAGAMNESHSDLFAMEYLSEYGFRPHGNTPHVIGGYVTGDPQSGIRNYDMSRSPLNYSDLSYDLVGQQVHADGEIWTATSFDVRQAFVDRYGRGTPAKQRACADGAIPVEQCPGNRRWIQLEFDALLLSANGAVSMVDIRDAMLAADQIRFGGANAAMMWSAFAQHGMGRDATSAGPNDADAVPSFASPSGTNAKVRIRAAGQAAGQPVKLYVGDYEGRALPIADTDPATPLGDTAELVPGTYSFIANGAGFGSTRFSLRLRPGNRTLPLVLLRNLASVASGATATGDGVNTDKLIDDTEATNWASLDSPVAGRSVTVDLAGSRPSLVSRVQVSALLRPAITTDPDPGGQSRFTALRRFEVLACNSAIGSNCSSDAGYRSVYTSSADAFPAGVPRPTAPDLNLRSFRIRPTIATHLRIRVLTNQCTGAPAYQGNQHDDPRSTSDCVTGNPVVASQVRISEFQAFTI